MGRFQQGVANERYALVATPARAAYLNYIFQQREASMPKVDQGQVTAVIAAGRSATRGPTILRQRRRRCVWRGSVGRMP